MKKLAAVAVVVVSLAVGAQSVTDSWDASRVVVESIALGPQPDGGCAARWCGSVASDDGGVIARACTDVVQLKATVNQNRCAGIAGAGVNRLARELRFEVDAGAQ